MCGGVALRDRDRRVRRRDGGERDTERDVERRRRDSGLDDTALKLNTCIYKHVGTLSHKDRIAH